MHCRRAIRNRLRDRIAQQASRARAKEGVSRPGHARYSRIACVERNLIERLAIAIEDQDKGPPAEFLAISAAKEYAISTVTPEGRRAETRMHCTDHDAFSAAPPEAANQ